MFKKLKEKLKSWLKGSKEKVEIDIEKVEETIKEEKARKIVEKVEIKEEGEETKAEGKKIEEKPVEEKQDKKSFFKRLGEKFRKAKISEQQFDEIFNDLEMILLENNMALEAVEKIKENLKTELVNKEIDKNKLENEIKQALKQAISNLMIPPRDIIADIRVKNKPYIILFLGINGSGKTTTIAKLAYLLKKHNISCVFSASDTFRAASIEQLEKHADKLNIKVIKNQYGSDPTSVAFDAVRYAEAHNIKAVLIDTAGRMHTKENLMREMEKIVRVIKPDLKIFVAESIVGNDIIEQAKTFDKASGIDCIILSKADVDEKGGSAISISYITGSPILFLGTGQNYKDLEYFDKEKVLKSLGF